MSSIRMFQAFQGRGGRGGGGRGGGQKNNSGNCGQHSMWWWGSSILDTGTPQGAGKGQVGGSPAALVNMTNSVYPNNNIILDSGVCYYVPAKDGAATGPRKALPCTQYNHFGWALEQKRQYQLAGWARRGGGGSLCTSFGRVIHATLGGKSVNVQIDTGTDTIFPYRGGGGSSLSCVFDPNPQAISIPVYHGQSSGGGGGGHSDIPSVPAWSMSQRIRICITTQYTICQSLSGGKTVSYDCSKGTGQFTDGDILEGKEWGTQTQQQTSAKLANVVPY